MDKTAERKVVITQEIAVDIQKGFDMIIAEGGFGALEIVIERGEIAFVVPKVSWRQRRLQEKDDPC